MTVWEAVGAAVMLAVIVCAVCAWRERPWKKRPFVAPLKERANADDPR